MNKAELKEILNAFDIHPSKKLGQNFLLDRNMLDAVLADVAAETGEEILEIGPGTGVLTAGLLESGARVTAIEYDKRLADFLGQRFAKGTGSLRLIQADAVRCDYDALFQGPYRCISNLPYKASSAIIMKLLDSDNMPQQMYLLLQREMALRLAATPATSDYSALSARVQMDYVPTVLRKIPGDAFWPKPEVASSFIRLYLKPPSERPDAYTRKKANALIKAGFSQRRKRFHKLIPSINLPPGTTVQSLLTSAEIPPDCRAETLSSTDFIRLALIIQKAKDNQIPQKDQD
jgi:16S rRNA (adenine1518-N6/adenine1519-N6)-dimethyltransferase